MNITKRIIQRDTNKVISINNSIPSTINVLILTDKADVQVVLLDNTQSFSSCPPNLLCKFDFVAMFTITSHGDNNLNVIKDRNNIHQKIDEIKLINTINQMILNKSHDRFTTFEELKQYTPK